MEFMDHLYQFGQFGILTFRDGIREVGGWFLLRDTCYLFWNCKWNIFLPFLTNLFRLSPE